MSPMRIFLFAAAACLWAGAAVAQYNSGATLNSAGSAVGGVPGHGIVIGPGSRQLQDTGGPPGTVTSVSVAPGHTTQVGVCNSSTNTITVSGTISGQTCALPVVANTTLGAPNAGAITIANGPGLTIKAPNPTGATQGVPWVVGGDGTDTFTLTTVSGTAQFYGCGLAGTGATSLTVPGTALVVITDDESSGSRYYCWTQGATVLANGATQGIMKGDGSTITCTTGVCSAVSGGSPAEVLISSQTAISGTTTHLNFTPLPTSPYRALRFACSNLLPTSNTATINVYVGEGGGPTWETAASYVIEQIYGRNDTTMGMASSNGSATSPDLVAGGLLDFDPSAPGAIEVVLANPGLSGVHKTARSSISMLRNGDTTPLTQAATSYWGGDTNTITGLQFIVSTGTFGGNCSEYGEN